MSDTDCDLLMTQDLMDLFTTPREQRDEAWIEDFFDVVPTAGLMALDPQLQRGPDGFPYVSFCLPRKNQEFDGFSVAHSIDYCLKNGCGIVIFKDPDSLEMPEWIFTFGNLWAYKQYGNFIGDPDLAASGDDSTTDTTDVTPPPEAEKDEAREVTVEPPSTEHLPDYARSAISRFLREVTGLKTPKVAMITDPTSKPSHSLVFTDLLPERFEKEEHFVQLMTAIRWFLPATSKLMVAVPQLAQFAQPL